MAITTSKEKLVDRLLEGNNDILTEFVIVGLKSSLEIICAEVERLLKVKNLSNIQFTDLNELYHDGTAIIRVLKYYTTHYYTDYTTLMNKAWDKLTEHVF